MYNLKDRRPRLLDCRHTFCEPCAQRLVDRRILINRDWEKNEAQRRKQWEIEQAENIAKAQREQEAADARAAKLGVRSGGAKKKKVAVPVFTEMVDPNENCIECPTCGGQSRVPNVRTRVSFL
jgi:hypothetical protein